MLSHQEMIGLQAEKHELINADSFASEEECVLHLIHTAAYLQATSLAAGKVVLDLGCNTGYGTDIMSKRARKIVGVDVSAGAIDTAKAKYGNRGIDFRLIDGQRLPFDDASFDMVVSCQVIEHIVDHAQFIAELKRVLKPDGVVVFTTPNAAIRLDPGMKPWNHFHVREYRAEELSSMLNGFFQHTSVLGLFASEPIYRIEQKRVDTARRAARANSAAAPAPASPTSTLKKVLPAPVVSFLNRVRDGLQSPPSEPARHTYPQYKVEELFYRRNNLETALDLIAVCANDTHAHTTALQHFRLS